MTFANLTTVADIDALYKQLFTERHCADDVDAYWELAAEHRLALERVTQNVAKASGPHKYTLSDVNVSAHELRAWAREQGLPCSPRGNINATVIELWCSEHAKSGTLF